MTQITVSTSIYAPIEKVRNTWTQPEHIMQRNHASDDWYCPAAANDLQVGWKFSSTMSAKDKSFSFDFNGEYSNIVQHSRIDYIMEWWRNVAIMFEDNNCGTVKVTETFDAETENSIEMQQQGRQAILDNFKKHVEQSL